MAMHLDNSPSAAEFHADGYSDGYWGRVCQFAGAYGDGYAAGKADREEDQAGDGSAFDAKWRETFADDLSDALWDDLINGYFED